MLAVLASALTWVSDLPPVEYERRSIEYREKLGPYHYAAAHVTKTSQADPVRRDENGIRYEIWSDGPRYRIDRTPLADWPNSLKSYTIKPGVAEPVFAPDMRRTWCAGCLQDGLLLEYSKPALPITFRKPDESNRQPFESAKYDPRGAGHFVVGRPPGASRARGMLTPDGVKNWSAERVRFRGEDAVLVRCEFVRDGGERRTWFVPNKGYSLLRLEIPVTSVQPSKRPYVIVIDNEIDQDPVSGVWFPKRSVAQSFHRGELENEQTVTVEVAEFNRPPDPAAFTLAGLKVTPGTPVYDSRTGNSRYWDGAKVTDRYSGPIPPELLGQVEPLSAVPSPTPALPPTPDPTRMPRWVYLVAGGLAMVGCALLALARRARS